MRKDISRREVMQAMGLGAAAIALAELGGVRPAWAEDAFTIASTGGSWGDGLKQAYVVKADFEKRFNAQVSYAHMIDSVIATKAIAQCGNPPFTVPALLNAEAVMLAEGGCLQDYDLGVVTNYKDLLPGTFEAPRAGLKAYWAAHTMIVMGLVYNTKRVTVKPTSFMDLGNPKYKGKIAIPAYGWVGIQWLHALNQSLGGTPDNIDPGMKAIAELVKKNDALIMENTDVTLKAFTREEIWMMPFWNGRCFSLQAEGVPVDIVYPRGSLQVGNGFPILKGTKFERQAQHFVNISLDAEYQIEMTRRFRYPPSNRKAKLPPEMAHYALKEADLKAMMPLDFQKMNQHRAAYLARWNREVLG
jgi:putative spermidine/putrescine transport system substrate-binding protein